MPKTFHIVQRMAPGGIESIVLDLARQDPEVAVISLEGERASLVAQWPVLTELGDRLIALAKPDGLRPVLWIQLARLLRRHKVEAVVTHHIGPLVYAGVAATLAGVDRRIHVEHDGWHYGVQKRRFLGRLIDYVVAPRRVAVSHATARQVALALGTYGQTIIPNGVDMQRFQPASRADARRLFNLPRDVKLIGTVGRLEFVKGQDVLIRSLALLEPHWHLVLAGDGRQRAALESLVQDLGLSERVHFLGQVDAPDQLYPAFDLFCLPSRAEGFPRDVIEAQACGVPVVAADVGGVREAVCPFTGRLVPANAPDSLANALKESAVQGSQRSPRAFVDPGFSNAVMLTKYRALLAA